MSEPHDFRVRTVLGKTIKIESAETELELAASGDVRVVLQSLSTQPLTDSREICIRGTGYASAEAARVQGERWRDAVIVGFACIGLGADFRERAPSGGMTAEFLAELGSQHPEVRFYNDLPGVQVFPSEPPAQFIRIEAEGVAGKFGAQVVNVVIAAKEREVALMDVHRLAFDLYSSSFFVSVADARFMMLSMALETLIKQQERPPKVRRQVDGLVAAVRSSNLEQSEIDSLVGGLRELGRESVGRAGRRLVVSLEGRLYMNMPAMKFFTHCYELRGRLVHGEDPRPTREEVDLTAAHLETLVGDLIAVELLDLQK